MFSIENILTVYLVILQFIFWPLFIYIFVNTIINEVRRVKSNREFNQFMEDKRYKKYDDSDKYEYEITDEEENMHNTEQFGEEILDKLQNTIDITDVLWQNILVEIPSKVRTTDEDIEIYGEGGRVITEEQFAKEMAKSNNPFSNLEELLNKKEEK